MKTAIFNRIHKLVGYTAIVTMGTAAGLFLVAFHQHRWELLIAAAVVPYAFPLLLYRILNRLVPQREGPSRMIKGTYHPWVAALRIQYLFGALPILEEVLRLIPGAYSTWLRLWGSKVGKNVFFAPGFNLVDRGHLDVGDDVIFGMGCTLSPHMVRYRGKRRMVYLKTIRIGSGAFIGGRCYLGPGSEIGAKHSLPGFANMTINMQNTCLLPEPRVLRVLPLDAPTSDERRDWLKELR